MNSLDWNLADLSLIVDDMSTLCDRNDPKPTRTHQIKPTAHLFEVSQPHSNPHQRRQFSNTQKMKISVQVAPMVKSARNRGKLMYPDLSYPGKYSDSHGEETVALYKT